MNSHLASGGWLHGPAHKAAKQLHSRNATFGWLQSRSSDCKAEILRTRTLAEATRWERREEGEGRGELLAVQETAALRKKACKVGTVHKQLQFCCAVGNDPKTCAETRHQRKDGPPCRLVANVRLGSPAPGDLWSPWVHVQAPLSVRLPVYWYWYCIDLVASPLS